MPIFNYKCDSTECDFKEEYIESFSIPKENWHPEICPKCNKGKLEKQFDLSGQSFDLVGDCYLNTYGKHAWKKNMSASDQAKVLAGEKDPY